MRLTLAWLLAMDSYRTRAFKEQNLLLSRGTGPFSKEKNLVFATALSDPAGRASAIYGVSRKCLRWGSWVGVATIDYDDDGWQDIVVANDGTPNFLFRNRGSGFFDDISIESGIALPVTGTPKGGMGIDFADFDDSGRPSILIGNLHDESLTLFRNICHVTHIKLAHRWSNGLGRRWSI